MASILYDHERYIKMATNGVARVEFRHMYRSQLVEWGIHWQREDAEVLSLEQLTALGIVLWDWWGANIAALTELNCTLTTVKLTDLSEGSTAVVEYSGGTLVGTGAGSAQANQTAMVVSLYAGAPSRNSRNRFYLPAINANLTVDGLWPAATLISISSALQQMVEDVGDIPWTWVTWSGTLSTAYSPVLFVVRPIPGTQATRRIGRGS